MPVRNIKIEDFDYPLPEDRIALHPLPQRDACKLLVAGGGGRISHHIFSDLPLLIKPDTLIVANETKVIRARMEFVKDTGARIEIFLLEPLHPHDYVTSFASTDECTWSCLVGNRKRWKENPLSKEIYIDGNLVTLHAFLESGNSDSSSMEVRFSWDNPRFSFAEIIEAAGNIPIPPYLKRKSEESDNSDYQTVYSRVEGSVAAPTAGLHFTPELISRLREYGDEFATVTLHVGAGTFQPVKSEEIGDHPMHTEWISVGRLTIRRILSALENGRDVMAVGTTSVRTLESLPYLGVLAERGEETKVTQWMPYEDDFHDIDTIRSLKALLRYMDENGLEQIETTTSIMIAPGFRWRIVNRLVTNFHQPKSTLLLLVSSFLGRDSEGYEEWRKVYSEALDSDYRFLSYGDACLFRRGRQDVRLPAAKSMVIRAATIRAINDPASLGVLERMGLCDDAEYYIRALRKVLQSVDDVSGTLTPIFIGEGAAPLRFLTAIAASLPGASVKITCSEGLQRRPLRPLVETLKALGADLKFNDTPSDWSLEIHGKRLQGGKVTVESSFTSQYLSALLLASPLWENGLQLSDESQVMVSRPYVRMTEVMLANPGMLPESDWSAAAFFYEYCFITRKEVVVESLVPPSQSLQGDAICCDFYARLGLETHFRDTCRPQSDAVLKCKETDVEEVVFDFTDCPDLVPSVAVALCYRRIPFRFSGVGHLRYKECDRLSALQSLLVRIGYEVSVADESLVFNGEFRPYEEFPLEIDPYGDHRMAMAFYPLELLGMVRIEDKNVVSKSFPNFYQQF